MRVPYARRRRDRTRRGCCHQRWTGSLRRRLQSRGASRPHQIALAASAGSPRRRLTGLSRTGIEDRQAEVESEAGRYPHEGQHEGEEVGQWAPAVAEADDVGEAGVFVGLAEESAMV